MSCFCPPPVCTYNGTTWCPHSRSCPASCSPAKRPAPHSWAPPDGRTSRFRLCRCSPHPAAAAALASPAALCLAGFETTLPPARSRVRPYAAKIRSTLAYLLLLGGAVTFTDRQYWCSPSLRLTTFNAFTCRSGKKITFTLPTDAFPLCSRGRPLCLPPQPTPSPSCVTTSLCALIVFSVVLGFYFVFPSFSCVSFPFHYLCILARLLMTFFTSLLHSFPAACEGLHLAF